MRSKGGVRKVSLFFPIHYEVQFTWISYTCIFTNTLCVHRGETCTRVYQNHASNGENHSISDYIQCFNSFTSFFDIPLLLILVKNQFNNIKITEVLYLFSVCTHNCTYIHTDIIIHIHAYQQTLISAGIMLLEYDLNIEIMEV